MSDDFDEEIQRLRETPLQRRWRTGAWIFLLLYAGGSGVYVAVEIARWMAG